MLIEHDILLFYLYGCILLGHWWNGSPFGWHSHSHFCWALGSSHESRQYNLQHHGTPLLVKSSFDFLNFSRFCREVDELLLLVHKSLWHVGHNSWNGGFRKANGVTNYFVGNCRWPKNAMLHELVGLATAHDFFASAFVGHLSGFLQEVLLTPVQICIYCGVLHQLVRRGQFLAVGTFFRVFAGQLEGTVSPPVCLFWLNFSPISELIVLPFFYPPPC